MPDLSVQIDAPIEVVPDAAPDGSVAAVSAAVETVASHLHPNPSYDLADHPLPTGREEVWRFTPLKRFRGLLQGGDAQGDVEVSVEAPAGVTVSEITADEARALGGPAPVDRVAALAAAHAAHVALVDVAAETQLDAPVVVTVTGRGAQRAYGNLLVRVGAFAKGIVVLEHRGSAVYAGNTTLLVGDGAQVEFAGLQLWDDDAVHGGQTSIVVGRDAEVRTIAASLGGDLVRLVETAEYAGPGGSVEQLGLYFVDAGQHIEHRLFVDHNAPHTRSNVDYRGALQGQGAHSVWIGDVLIRKVAEGIETYESNKNLVLTDGCRADSVPNLEIETGDIAGAGHASTTGRFDDEQLFYLRSRGIDEAEARRLVVHGFFADIIRRIGVAGVEERLLAAVEAELEVNVGLPTQPAGTDA
ncbi:Fe-S cluster assembly protein SufD [Microlunatus flavus]|uniref:Fe-S cluster assembly protein SufD n=1 Tax=Microlunatus flavus TaxID=1036181 RepID=A0A1H9H209_9ACTN|nr:Fe-S cluster assembly protein SufD [Microlunatus flavus]